MKLFLATTVLLQATLLGAAIEANSQTHLQGYSKARPLRKLGEHLQGCFLNGELIDCTDVSHCGKESLGNSWYCGSSLADSKETGDRFCGYKPYQVWDQNTGISECYSANKYTVKCCDKFAYDSNLPVNSVGDNGKYFIMPRTDFPFTIDEGPMKQGSGTALTVWNPRKDEWGGIDSVVATVMDDDDSTIKVHYNPLYYSTEGDFEVGEELSILYYRSLSECNRVSFSVVAESNVGWNIDADAVRIGKSGLVGPWWKELTLQFTLDSPVTTIWTDAVSIAGDMKVSTVVDGEVSTDVTASVIPDFPELYLLSEEVSGTIQITFPSTDFKSLNGLSSYRDGGGLHIDLCA